jgi:hypothetical protein
VNFAALGGNHRVFHVGELNNPLEYRLNFTIPGLDVPFDYSLQVRPDGAVSEERLLAGGKSLFNHAKGQKWVHAPDVTPLPKPTGIMLGAIPGLQESTFAFVALRSGIGCYDFPGNVLAGPGNAPQPTETGLADHGENYLLVANQILSDLGKARSWTRIAKTMRAVDRAVSTLTLHAPTPDRLDVGHQLNGKLLSFDVRQESEGFRRYLAHMLALYQNPSKQTLIFEHPESGLHPGALESLAEEFKDCPEEGRGQVILTTHSPQLLDYFPPDSIRVVDIDQQRTRIDRLTPEQLNSVKERLLLPGELLTVDPARLPGQLDEVPG